MPRFKVNIDRLHDASTKVSKYADEYQEQCNNLFNKFDELHNVWEGDDKDVYIQRVNEFRNNFTAMYKDIMDFSIEMKRSADSYRTTVDANANEAKKLAY